MRRFAPLCLLLACAHAQRSGDPQNWVEAQTEHFLLQTDLAPDDARRAAADLELLRLSLLAAGWHVTRPGSARTRVVELLNDAELREFAAKGVGGFVATDAFDEPIMVVSDSQDPLEAPFVKHELAHVITNQFLVSKPRWVSEGIACYLETIKLDRRHDKILIGTVSDERGGFLSQIDSRYYAAAMRVGREAQSMGQISGYTYETAAWLLVHWLVDIHSKGFDAFLGLLAQGEKADQAFAKAFPELMGDDAIHAGVQEYLKKRQVRVDSAPLPQWSGDVALRKMDPAEVHALRADLLRLSPGYFEEPARTAKMKAELLLALQADPGNPVALQLSSDADRRAGVKAHPDDWRAWLVAAGKEKIDRAAIETAARLAPDNAGVLERLALAELNEGAPDLALKHAQRAAAISPERADVLDSLAQVYYAAGRCELAHAKEEQAISALPDTAVDLVDQLYKRQSRLDWHCGEPPVEKTVAVEPVLKGCSRKMPVPTAKDGLKGALEAAFTIREDGSVADVSLSAAASAAFLSRMKSFVESCSYDPVLIEGKPTSVKSRVVFDRPGRR